MLSCSFGLVSIRGEATSPRQEHDSYLVWRAGLQSLIELHASIPFDAEIGDLVIDLSDDEPLEHDE
jgi:hypothetical protein